MVIIQRRLCDYRVPLFNQLKTMLAADNIELCLLYGDGTPQEKTKGDGADIAWVKVVRGDGNLFWNRGMHLGYTMTLKQDADAYLWVNDDTQIVDNALLHVINTWQTLEQTTGKPVVVSGASADETTCTITYGGDVAKSQFKRFTYQKVCLKTCLHNVMLRKATFC